MFYDNFIKACNVREISPSAALTKAGIDKSAGTRWKKGKIPTDATIQKLADYFGLSKAELIGEVDFQSTSATSSDNLQLLADALEQLNEEGQEKLLDYAADLVASGRYIKSHSVQLGQKA